MSDRRFSVILEEHELEILRHYLPTAAASAKPVRARAARTAAAVEAFTPNTGNAAVDEFMRRKHDPKWKPKAPKMGPGLPPLKPLKVSEQDAAEAAWKSACDEARAVVADGKPSKAEAILRDLIATHRNPWRHEATEGTPRNAVRILTSPRHPGVAIHEMHEAGSSSKTWRVMAGGVLSEKKHYAMQAAELEADEAIATLT